MQNRYVYKPNLINVQVLDEPLLAVRQKRIAEVLAATIDSLLKNGYTRQEIFEALDVTKVATTLAVANPGCARDHREFGA